MKSKQPQWRIVQLGPEHYEVQRRLLGFLWWIDPFDTYFNTLKAAQTTLGDYIMRKHTYPRVVETVDSDVEYVKARLSQ